ncbi:ArsR/SmtB family transcription factor [Aeromicrobium chenweiae]|uniref:Transcriptional regulator n=1 Tax=Aeromicrobium chenweiae TaxID=2079793 RepID=A0A2S0WI63_9ACTN|nr:metalloregulator ArsR/SmtB family transcription factor [Aeromicrobium chenweiae]AWB91029.1 transcriptional regulator [Aeromicrobium chenweiae]TGN31933.1 transcriptional regulator [Aeromicrobium chenweiae]
MATSGADGPIDLSACCAPLASEAMSAEDAVTLSARFKALGDPTRVRLLSMVAAHDGAEACVCDLTGPVGLSQPTVSHHLKILVDAGLLSRTKRGIWSYYAVVPGSLEDLAATLVAGAPARV